MYTSNKNNRIEERDIDKLERKLNKKLPDEYRKFLLLYNGGTPIRNLFTRNLELGCLVVNDLHGINAEHKYNDLYHMIDVYDGRIPSNFIPIGGDPGGNVFCLCISEDFYGKVYFWDHNNEDDSDEKVNKHASLTNNMYFLSDDFNSFVNRLTEASN